MQNEWQPEWMEEEHILLANAVRKFFAAELAPHTARWRKNGVVDRDFWRKAGQAGLMGGSVPTEYGGSGGDYSHDTVVIIEHAGTDDSGWGFGIQNIVIHYVMAFGTPEQKQRWLPGLVSGEIVAALAMTEPGTGSDLQAVRTRADRAGNSYVINGSKTFITNGQTTELICLVAKTDPGQGAKGISLIMVETEGAEGFTRGGKMEKLGLKAQDTAELFFEDVRVPQTNLLGLEEGQGFYQLMKQLPWERLMLGIAAVKACDVMIAQTLAYVRERKVFGKRVMDFQNTRFKLAEAKTKTEVLRAFIDRCVEKLLKNELDTATASMAKFWGSQVRCEIADECLQLHGGYGYMMEYPIARAYADARIQKIYGGTNEIMKDLIARAMDI
jgi:alkylation response protein AidB-like acyl-CoA dehydrogenase